MIRRSLSNMVVMKSKGDLLHGDLTERLVTVGFLDGGPTLLLHWNDSGHSLEESLTK